MKCFARAVSRSTSLPRCHHLSSGRRSVYRKPKRTQSSTTAREDDSRRKRHIDRSRWILYTGMARQWFHLLLPYDTFFLRLNGASFRCHFHPCRSAPRTCLALLIYAEPSVRSPLLPTRLSWCLDPGPLSFYFKSCRPTHTHYWSLGGDGTAFVALGVRKLASLFRRLKAIASLSILSSSAGPL